MSDRTPRPRRRPWARAGTRTRRRIAGFVAIGVALLAVGGIYAAVQPAPQTATGQDAALVREGQALFDNSCITCHGSNLQGVVGRGPSLIGVGQASVYFQVSTGRMPLKVQGAQADRKKPEFDPAQIDALGAYIEANGGGPSVPAGPDEALVGSDLGRGGELFRLNCAQCHNFTGRGGALSSGKFAPVLDPATPHQIYAAMLSGPGNMPTFADSQLSPEEKRDIIGYIKSVSSDSTGANPGGNGLGGFGPVPEGLVAFFVGLAALIGISLWIGSRQ
ncbi:c-type cytochrome [Actinomycetospora sp. TBRC 11914]|uniref:cytochrome bc1 complex diheme cytochrome c subunit n=1 Tax=Actinomycetospora sp. TBRC 11914 TaxID=2729387 RepID=UPI00145EE300|nr:cytochrome c [Actinomycetospora sp. TBRC 11914]NMO93363.1 c-type cytochrome [Actinomycetospora sp. TBRC 11914]